MVKLSISVLVAAVCLVAAQAAPAATPFTVGQGAGAHIVVSTDGSGQVVWGIPARGGTPAKIGYCHLPAGASACDVTQEFNFPPAAGQVATIDPLDVTIVAPRALELRIFAACKACGDGSAVDHIYTWGSTTNGTTWAPDPILLGTTPTTEGIQPDGTWIGDTNTFVSPGEGTETLVFQTLGAVASHFPVVSPGYVYSPSTVRVPTLGGELQQVIQASGNLGSIQYAYFESGDINGATIGDPLKWKTSQSIIGLEPDSAEPHLTTGPANAYLTYRRSVPGDNQILIRRYSSSGHTFSPSTPLQGDDAIDNSADGPHSDQDQAGRIHVIWTSGYDTGRLRYTRSDDSVTSWSPPLNIAQGETFADPVVAGDPGGAGWAAWSQGADSPVRVVRLEPYAEKPVTNPPATCTPPATGTPPNCKTPTTPTATTVKKTVAVSGASITLGLPKACVKPGKTFKVTLTWKKKKKKGNLFVKVIRSDFYIGTKRVKIDKKAPFTQTLTVTASSKAGSKLTVRAQAFIKVKRGKSPKKSIKSTISVCA